MLVSDPTQFKDHFSRLAAEYAQFRPHYPSALFDFVAQACKLRQRAWDCACGSGQATRDLAERFDSVIATDASAQQIAAAEPHPRVTYAVARAEQSGLESESVDLVAVAQSLHWFERDGFYREVARVLRAEGVLAVWSYATPRTNTTSIDRIVQRFHSDTVGPFWPLERRIVEDGYRTLEFPFLEMQAPSLSMHEQWTLPQFLGYLRSWSATGRYVDRNGDDPVVAVGAELEPLWGGTRVVSWPLSVRIGRK